MDEIQPQHGGKRAGAGRKSKFAEPTTRLRVPNSIVPAVNDLLDQVVTLRSVHQADVEVVHLAAELSECALPLFASPVAAGFPSPADDYVEGALDLNAHFIHHPAATFCVRATGESMNGAGILPGDILIVDRSLTAKHGSIVIAVVDNELTVKRLYKQGGKVALRAENPDFPTIECHAGMELVIWGVVSGVTRKL